MGISGSRRSVIWKTCLAVLFVCGVITTPLFYQSWVNQHFYKQHDRILQLLQEICLTGPKPSPDALSPIEATFHSKVMYPYNSLFNRDNDRRVPSSELDRLESQLRDLLHQPQPMKDRLWDAMDLVDGLSPPTESSIICRKILEGTIGPRQTSRAGD